MANPISVKELNDLGLWSALSFLLQLGLTVAGLIFVSRRRRLQGLNFTFALVEGVVKERTNSNRQLTFLVRNLSGTDVLLGSASFCTKSRKVISNYADGDAASNEFELKFKTGEELFSNSFTLVKSTHHVITWIPADESLTIMEIIATIQGKAFHRSYLRCKVITLGRRPEVVYLKIPVINIQHRPHGLYFAQNTVKPQLPDGPS